MAHAPELLFNLIFGRWRSQTLYAGAAIRSVAGLAVGQGMIEGRVVHGLNEIQSGRCHSLAK